MIYLFIMAACAYYIIFQSVRYAVAYFDYKTQLRKRRRKTNTPRAWYQPLEKPNFFNN